MKFQQSQAHDVAVAIMPSGIFLPHNAVDTALRVMVDATQFNDVELADLVDSFADIQMHHPYVKPIFLVATLDPAHLSAAGFMYETVMPESAWSQMCMTASYQEYKERRISEMISVYSANRAGTLAPGANVPRWFYER